MFLHYVCIYFAYIFFFIIIIGFYLWASVKEFHDTFVSDQFLLNCFSLYTTLFLYSIEGLKEDLLLLLNVSPSENKD